MATTHKDAPDETKIYLVKAYYDKTVLYPEVYIVEATSQSEAINQVKTLVATASTFSVLEFDSKLGPMYIGELA